MKSAPPRVYLWQNNMCITYTLVFKRFEDWLLANNARLVDDPEAADWLLIGACASFMTQIDDFLQKSATLSGTTARVAVYGCLPKVTPEQYRGTPLEVDLYIPPEQPEKIECLLPGAAVRWEQITDNGCFRRQDYRHYDTGKRFIVVQTGCNAGCVYCPHKIGMGPQISRPAAEIWRQSRLALREGAHTLFIEGMDSGSWGTDLEPPQTYFDLLEPMLHWPEKFDLHLGQFGANWMIHYADRAVSVLAHPRIRDLKTPIQSASSRLLKLMGRDERIDELWPVVRALKQANPKLYLRTDLIIGFPTETDEELEKTLDLVIAHFDEVAYFGFELHPHTPIARMNLPLLPAEQIRERLEYTRRRLAEYPHIIAHRGGQDGSTLVEREQRRQELQLNTIG
ncbi:MAG: tRNA-2-methylthio-N(6)-dimethylallyladenosine synthase [Phycisphaerae bacterium]|nr:tRNA-2-methylthio-N(6)-dimethylallyladenosine synthase [Phycisphaerae bacterium]